MTRKNITPLFSASPRTRSSRSKLFAWILLGMLSATVSIGSLSAQKGKAKGKGKGKGARTATNVCTDYRMEASGTGPHGVVIETNCSPGIAKGTIYRPADLGGEEKYPILAWGEGGCSQNGLSNQAAMTEIASHGYFVIADGMPNGGGNIPMGSGDMTAMGAPLIAYIDWAIAENGKSSSPYYQSLDAKKISTNGFSCGGLMAIGTVGDPRITAWGVTSSGMARVNDDFYELVHTPVLFVEGGENDIAYAGGTKGYETISTKLDVPVLWLSKDLGHGGDLFTPNGGDFTKIILAWLNWQLKGDETATGKGLLVGKNCPYCSDSAWDVKSAHIP